MDIFSISFIFLAIPMVLLLISEPNILKNTFTKKIEVVGPSYWGNYSGANQTEARNLKCIEIHKSQLREKVVAGSISYMGGKNSGSK